MEIDVAGRQGRTAVGKAKGLITAANDPNNGLAFTNAGVMPRDTHRGVDATHPGRRHVSGPESGEAHGTGKRHIYMVHEEPHDLIKRRLGKFGLKKVKVVTVETAPELRSIGHGGDGMQPAQRPFNCNESCENRAKRFVTDVAAGRQDLEAAARKAVSLGGTDLLQLEAKLRRAQRSDERASLASTERRDRPTSLGEPSAFAPPAPFAITSTPPPPHRPTKKHVDPPKHSEFVHSSKRVVAHLEHRDTPFDTCLDNQRYPEPPSCGTVCPPPPGKKHVDPASLTTIASNKHDVDSINARKATFKLSARPKDAPVMPDFVFGNPPPPICHQRSPQRPHTVNLTLLDDATATRGAPQTARAPPSRFSALKYKPTALW